MARIKVAIEFLVEAQGRELARGEKVRDLLRPPIAGALVVGDEGMFVYMREPELIAA